ncbi:MAG: FHA domain-containing protein [Tepidiformaceae bacterium]
MGSERSTTAEAAIPFAGLFWLSGPRRGQHATLSTDGTTIGTGGDSDVLIDEPGVSLEHARLRMEEGEWFVYDLASRAGTTIGGETIYRHRLADGDRIGFGTSQVVFRVLNSD